LADVAREAGVSTGIIHYHFRYNDDLLLAALDWAGDQIERRLNEQSVPMQIRCIGSSAARAVGPPRGSPPR